MTFQVIRWRSGPGSSTRRTVVFDCLSEVSIIRLSRTGTRCLDWSSTHLVEVSIPTGEGSLPRLPRHSPQCSERAHQRTYQLAQPRLWLTMMGLMVVVVIVVVPTRSPLSRPDSYTTCLNVEDFREYWVYNKTREGRSRGWWWWRWWWRWWWWSWWWTLTSRLRTSASTDSSTSAARVMVKYDEVDGGRSGAVDKSVKKSSKKSKNLKGLKSRKCHRFGGTKLPDLRHYASLYKEVLTMEDYRPLLKP